MHINDSTAQHGAVSPNPGDGSPTSRVDLSPAAPLRVILADDHQIVRAGMKSILAVRPEWRIVGEATSPEQLVELLRVRSCDVLVTDYSMPSSTLPDGARLMSFLRRQFPGLGIVLVTMISNTEVLRSTSKMGVDALLEKSAGPEEYLAAIDAVAQGRRYVGRSTVARLAMCRDNDCGLTLGQLEVVRMLAAGRTVADIARITNRSRGTVYHQRRRALQQLGSSQGATLSECAARLGLAHAQLQAR